jgi:hypothetical protein
MQTEITYEHLNGIRAEMEMIRAQFPAAYKYIFPRVDAFFNKNKTALGTMDNHIHKLFHEYVVIDEKTGQPVFDDVPQIIDINRPAGEQAKPKQQLKFKPGKNEALFELANKELQKKFVKVEL